MYNTTAFLQYGVFCLFVLFLQHILLCLQAGNFSPTHRENRDLKAPSLHCLEYLASRLTNAAWRQVTVYKHKYDCYWKTIFKKSASCLNMLKALKPQGTSCGTLMKLYSIWVQSKRDPNILMSVLDWHSSARDCQPPTPLSDASGENCDCSSLHVWISCHSSLCLLRSPVFIMCERWREIQTKPQGWDRPISIEKPYMIIPAHMINA